MTKHSNIFYQQTKKVHGKLFIEVYAILRQLCQFCKLFWYFLHIPIHNVSSMNQFFTMI